MMNADVLRKRVMTDNLVTWQALRICLRQRWLDENEERTIAGIVSWAETGNKLTATQYEILRSVVLPYVDDLALICGPSEKSKEVKTLRTLEAAYQTIEARPTAYPYRPGTIPKATKERKLKKLRKEIDALKLKLGVS